MENPLNSNKTLQLVAVIYELVGTMFLTMTIAGSGQWALAAGGASLHMTGIIAMFTLWYCVVMLGRVSMSMLNAVVCIAFMIRKEEGRGHFHRFRYGIPYLIVEVLGAVLGACVILWMYGDVGYPSVPPNSSAGRACIYEVFGSFTLIAMIMNVSDPRTSVSSELPLVGMMVGLALAVGVYLSSGVSGGGINPSVAIGLTLVKYAESGDTAVLSDLWIYILFPILGGFLAVAWHQYANVRTLQIFKDEENTPSPQQKYEPDRGLESDR